MLLAGLMALGLFIYLVYVLIKTGGVLPTSSAFIQVLLYLGVLFMLAYPLAGFMVKRMQAPLSANEQRWFSRFGMLGVDNHGKLSDEMN